MPAATADAGSADRRHGARRGGQDGSAGCHRRRHAAGQPAPAPAPSKDVVEKAKALQAKLDGWAFKLPQYDATKLQWKQDDLLKSTKSTS